MESLKPTCLLSFGTDSSCSGLVISARHGLILSHATLMLPYLSQHTELLKKLLSQGYLKKDAFKGVPAEAMFERESMSKVDQGQYVTSLLNIVPQTSSFDTLLIKSKADVMLLHKVKPFENTLRHLFPKQDNWTFMDSAAQKASKDVDPDKFAAILPFFVLLKTRKPLNVACPWSVVPQGSIQERDSIYAVGTPFGKLSPPVFLNAVSKGIVSKVAGKERSLILTDARCVPGCEGGAMYIGHPKHRQIAAMTVAPLCWKSNEWVGLTIACSLGSILTSLRPDVNISAALPSLIKEPGLAGQASLTGHSPRVVMVQSPSSWGSGLLVDVTTPLVITCGHVVKASSRVQVRVDVSTSASRWFTARVLFAVPRQQAFDIAILHIEGLDIPEEQLGTFAITEKFSEGDAVSMCGHGVFGREHRLLPSVSQGVVSCVRSMEGLPVMLQSTCAVHAGASGGPLVAEDGSFLAIVTCNAKDTSTGALYPHINLSVPLSTLWPLIQEYLRTQDPLVLEPINVNNQVVQKLWSLQLSAFPNEGALASKL